jgi:hypothetical protein
MVPELSDPQLWLTDHYFIKMSDSHYSKKGGLNVNIGILVGEVVRGTK